MLKRAKQWFTPTNLIGLGLVLFVIHSKKQPLLEYLFLPQIGFALILAGLIHHLTAKNSLKLTNINLGPKYIYIPLLVIVGSMIARIAVAPTMNSVASAIFGLFLFGLYIAGRNLGQTIFKPLTIAIIVEAVSLVLLNIAGRRTGGLLSPTNYDIAVGFLAFGAVVSISQKQWLIMTIALIGLFFTGSDEAIIVVLLVGGAILIRKDWGRRLLLPIGALVVLIATSWLFYPSLYKNTVSKLAVMFQPKSNLVIREEIIRYPNSVNYILNNRLRVIQAAMNDIKPLGHGYETTAFTFWTVHNVPLIIVDQIGPLAGLAWLWVTIACLIKTKWKYAFVAVIALSLFDHYIWTQTAPYWWVLVGVSTTSPIESDLIFRRAVENSSSHTLS